MAFRDDFLAVAAEIEMADPAPIDLLIKASSILAAWQHAGGEHVAPVPDVDPEALKAELAETEKRAADLRARVPR